MCISGPPADGPFLHVVFYPAHSTMLQKMYIRTPADGSQRVNTLKKNSFMNRTVVTLANINPLDARSRYTDFAQTSLRRQKLVYRRHSISTSPPEAGIPYLFSNAYWHQNARVIEIQTRQQLKINCFHET